MPKSVTSAVRWRRITGEKLDLDYGIIMSPTEAQKCLLALENEVQYFENDLAKVKIFGKWHLIPRKQASYGDVGLSYRFSGNTIPALPWTPTLLNLKTKVEEATGNKYNFVLVNRYADGNDYMGEHKDDEKELDAKTPIASLSLGAMRDFVFKHEDTKKGGKVHRNIKFPLENGSLLLMNFPTNQFWYHSLPKRKSCKGIRINLTFRKMVKVR